MKAVEKKMLRAIKERKNLTCGNTTVRFINGNCVVHLFGNVIASSEGDKWWLRDCGWRTPTTKSRLNALLSFLRDSMTYIYQKKRVWYVRDFVGEEEYEWRGHITVHNDVLLHAAS